MVIHKLIIHILASDGKTFVFNVSKIGEMPNLTLLVCYHPPPTNKWETILYILFLKYTVRSYYLHAEFPFCWTTSPPPPRSLPKTILGGIRPSFLKQLWRKLFRGICNLQKPYKSIPCSIFGGPEVTWKHNLEAAWEHNTHSLYSPPKYVRTRYAFKNSCQVLVKVGMSSKCCAVSFWHVWRTFAMFFLVAIYVIQIQFFWLICNTANCVNPTSYS